MMQLIALSETSTSFICNNSILFIGEFSILQESFNKNPLSE